VISVKWPHGRRFAFSIFDDCDWASIERVKPVYDLLTQLEMRATKSVWVNDSSEPGVNVGATCNDREYLNWVLELQRKGFEIALHNVAPGTSTRTQVREGLARFRQLFGDSMIAHANHVGCREGIYWGDARVSGWRRELYKIFTRDSRGDHRGHVEGDPLFWGDLCRDHVRYVRNFVFPTLNTLAACPMMPYHDSERPWVNFWFAGSDGGNRRVFLENFTFEKIDALEREGGLCIAYVHFGAGFVRPATGELDPDFTARMKYLASKDGWFPSVSQVLDFLRSDASPENRRIQPAALRKLETRWLMTKSIQGVTRRLRPAKPRAVPPMNREAR
jgi:hypothetical protein